MKRSQKEAEKRCKKCFQYQPIHVKKCRACGSEFSHKPSNLSLWQELKRLLGI